MTRNHLILSNTLPERHPYALLLYSGLRKHGFEVQSPQNRAGVRLCAEIAAIFPKTRIVHLHWIEHVFSGGPGKFPAMAGIVMASAFLCFLALAKFLGKKIVITIHNVEPHRTLFPRLEKEVFGLAIRIADAVIVHNAWSKRKAVAVYRLNGRQAGKISVIPHGNFIGYYKNSAGRKKARASLQIPQNCFVLLVFGEMREQKGIAVFLKAAGNAIKKDKGIFVVFAGRCLEDRVKESILSFAEKFKGNCIARLEFIPDAEVRAFINAADAGVLPYERVSTSGALILFMSCNKAVIAPKLGPVTELLGAYPLLFKPKNAKSLERAIFKSKKLRLEKIGEGLRAKSKRLGWKTISGSTARLFEKILDRRRGGQKPGRRKSRRPAGKPKTMLKARTAKSIT
ncbi:MAG: glycosyltransferase [Candidatus Diapherotrites archaeon]|nr:glycosyltransferase [Candidatus Diapherotrites archaeon]